MAGLATGRMNLEYMYVAYSVFQKEILYFAQSMPCSLFYKKCISTICVMINLQVYILLLLTIAT